MDGEAGLVRSLIRQGADVAAVDDNQYTALHQAAYKGHTAVIQELRAARASLDAHNTLGTTTLMLASKEGMGEALELILSAGCDQNNNGESALRWAARYCQLSAMEQLVKAGARTHQVTPHSHSLYRNGAQVDDEGKTPLGEARSDDDIVSYLSGQVRHPTFTISYKEATASDHLNLCLWVFA